MSEISDLTAESLRNLPTGSVYINNTSYSGADIKIVVHLYDGSQVENTALDQNGVNIMNAQTAYNEAESRYTSLSVALESVHEGAQEQTNYSRERNKAYQDMQRIRETINAMYQEMSRLQKNIAKKTTKVLAEAQTISISSHRDKQAVRTCGRVYPVAYARGQREIAGSLIFTVFNESVLYEFLESHISDFDGNSYTSALLDQLPPVDITIIFANEYGQTSRMAIYGVEFLNEGQTMSIEDILTENVVNYVARDYDPMRSVAHRKIDENSRLVSEWTGTKASDLILEDDYQNSKTLLDPFERFNRRNWPFL
jgi:hypothetical protein